MLYMCFFIILHLSCLGGEQGLVRGDGVHDGGDRQPRGRDPAGHQPPRSNQTEIFTGSQLD